MTIYTKLTIAGVAFSDSNRIDIERSIGDFNGTSTFIIEFDNDGGKYDDTFDLHDEVIVYADIDSTPATSKIFSGVIEDVSYSGNENKEKITLAGRDYGAVLQNMTVQPVVYRERDAGEIAKVITKNNAEGIVTTTNMDVTTGVIIESIGFNHKNIFDSLKQLAELSGYYFYVDEDKDVHFVVKEGVSSGLTFDNTNITQASFKTDDKEIFNRIWVYGSRILTGATDVGGIGAGSVFTLTDKPHSIRVLVSDVLQEKGGIIHMDNPETETGIKWVVDFDEKEIVFVSGTAAGDNIPASGATNVTVNYERSTPILKFKQDATSVTTYGPRTKIMSDPNIKNFLQASEQASKFLEENKTPKIMGDIEVYGVVSVTPGNTCVINIPFHNINSQTYTILNVSYMFNKRNNLSDSVLRMTLNRKISDFTDTMKDTMLRVKDFETGPLEGTLVRLETSIGSMVPELHWEVWSQPIGSAFIFGNTDNNRFESSQSLLGEFRAGSTLNISGGDF